MWTRGGNEVPVFPVELLALNLGVSLNASVGPLTRCNRAVSPSAGYSSANHSSDKSQNKSLLRKMRRSSLVVTGSGSHYISISTHMLLLWRLAVTNNGSTRDNTYS